MMSPLAGWPIHWEQCISRGARLERLACHSKMKALIKKYLPSSGTLKDYVWKKMNWFHTYKILLLLILLVPTIQTFIDIPRTFDRASAIFLDHTRLNPSDSSAITVLAGTITFLEVIFTLFITYIAIHAVAKENCKMVAIFASFLTLMVVTSALLKLEDERLLFIDSIRSLMFFLFALIIYIKKDSPSRDVIWLHDCFQCCHRCLHARGAAIVSLLDNKITLLIVPPAMFSLASHT